MVYFKAIELREKPFIQWDSVAFSLQELQDLKLKDDPLVLAEDKIPTFQFGVCPLQIVDGELVERSVEDMEKFEREYNLLIDKSTKDKKRDELKKIHLEIMISKDLGEDTTDFANEYKRLQAEYLKDYPLP